MKDGKRSFGAEPPLEQWRRVAFHGSTTHPKDGLICLFCQRRGIDVKQLILAATMCAVSGPAFAQSAAEIAVAHTVAQFCELDVPSEIDMPNLLAGRVFQDGGAMEFAQTIVQMERALTDMPDHAKPLFCEAARIGFPR